MATKSRRCRRAPPAPAGLPQQRLAQRPPIGCRRTAHGPAWGLTVRVSDREVRSLISNGYLSLERSEAAAAVAIALEAWIADNVT